MSNIISRREKIKEIAEEYDGCLFITSAGMISRELYDVHDSPNNFYMQGSMGCCLGFALGLAINQSDRDIVVLLGDGETLMSLGTLVLMNKVKLKCTIYVCILDNNQYQSTGGQPTCSDGVRFNEITNCNVFKVHSRYKPSPRIELPHKQIAKRFYETINSSK